MKAKKEAKKCDFNKFRRTRYFHGMLLDDKDFKNEQSYHADKRRLLNRTLHGSGIACGLNVEVDAAGHIKLYPGLALDCCGNEIWVDSVWEGSVEQFCLIPKKETGQDPCREENTAITSYHLVIQYNEKPTDPVSVYLPGESCNQSGCEPSRTSEGYCLSLHEGGDCPQCDPASDPCPAPGACPKCGDCGNSCSVILGVIEKTVEGQNTTYKYISNCRRYILTGRLITQMITNTFTASDPVNPGKKRIDVPGKLEPASDPVQALCSLLGYLKTVENDIKTINERLAALPPGQTN